MSTQDIAAKIATFRKKLIQTLVAQGADEHYATLYVDARVQFSDTFGTDGSATGNVVATLTGVSDSPNGINTPEGLRSFARRMRHVDRAAQLGAKQLPGMSRSERLDVARDNFVDALIAQGASLETAQAYVRDHVNFGVTSSDGPVIAELANGAQFEDDGQGMRFAASSLQSLHPTAALSSEMDDTELLAAEAARKRQQLAGAV